ncbi:MAG: YggS family pyridoxal phosphate-dependent enzyme, partial [Candidatus Omnitrophica bacterium]|nr:YggS family pyridoxal phosphate-dependent enzyme [Candidatus Omnitrophota bacterium]
EPALITLVAVSKNRSAGQIREALDCGILDIGENRVQEALPKYRELQNYESANSLNIRWHMVGHLQTNKVAQAVEIFDLIHSVDSLRLAEKIDKQAARINKAQDILVEVKTSAEAAKFGVIPQDLAQFFKEISGLKNLKIKGLMTVAPLVDNIQESRPYFKRLRELYDSIGGLSVLSMGMSDDFEAALEEGSNMVRIGRAIFGG